ncbi:MAG: hypothetical protein COB67_08705 [SAR324 cluster bacterium]|uniref:Uncharacterized protein n=1 Tax=SAR324 cluster bacterium TaxID=2024889 RepID=A0A2A4T1E9_9DELT|nr:MAG: hypothetical protein COB67_08705 [SAR324 cluster bacterium]
MQDSILLLLYCSRGKLSLAIFITHEKLQSTNSQDASYFFFLGRDLTSGFFLPHTKRIFTLIKLFFIR